jgi:hypothetical protein
MKRIILRLLSETDTVNGFANRFLWIMVKRSRPLPYGGKWSMVDTARSSGGYNGSIVHMAASLRK